MEGREERREERERDSRGKGVIIKIMSYMYAYMHGGRLCQNCVKPEYSHRYYVSTVGL